MDIDEFANFASGLADAASDSIMPYFRASPVVENKGTRLAERGNVRRFDPVTAADRDAEAAMRRLITAHYPAHGIVGEEYGADRQDADFVWVLDPIDGTRAFITGLPVWGILIGLLHEGRPVFGMMAQPFTGERYSGDGNRAWYTGPGGARQLVSRPCPALAEACLFTTSPFAFSDEEIVAYRAVEGSVRLARYGCDCYAYCMVAAGQADLVIEAGLHSFDVVALIPIVEGAGGRFTTWDGGMAAPGGRVAAAGDPRLHELALERLQDGGR